MFFFLCFWTMWGVIMFFEGAISFTWMFWIPTIVMAFIALKPIKS